MKLLDEVIAMEERAVDSVRSLLSRHWEPWQGEVGPALLIARLAGRDVTTIPKPKEAPKDAQKRA